MLPPRLLSGPVTGTPRGRCKPRARSHRPCPGAVRTGGGVGRAPRALRDTGGSLASTFRPVPSSPAPSWPWQELGGMALAGGFPWIQAIQPLTWLCSSLAALQALREYESPSFSISQFIQLKFQRRFAELRLLDQKNWCRSATSTPH